MNWIIYLATAAVVAICAIVTLLWVSVTITNMFDANFGNEDNVENVQ